MSDRVVFLLDNDKDFLELYSKLLQSKGCQVFATDNLFLLLKYAKTALPDWIFIDETFAPAHEADLIHMIDRGLVGHHTHFAIMGNKYRGKNPYADAAIEFVYKPKILGKMMDIAEKSCNMQ